MSNQKMLEKVKNMTSQERRNIPYEEIVAMVKQFMPEEIIELSNVIGYPVLLDFVWGH